MTASRSSRSIPRATTSLQTSTWVAPRARAASTFLLLPVTWLCSSPHLVPELGQHQRQPVHRVVAVGEHQHLGQLHAGHQLVHRQRLVSCGHHGVQLGQGAGQTLGRVSCEGGGRHHAAVQLRLEQVELLQLLGVVAERGFCRGMAGV